MRLLRTLPPTRHHRATAPERRPIHAGRALRSLLVALAVGACAGEQTGAAATPGAASSATPGAGSAGGDSAAPPAAAAAADTQAAAGGASGAAPAGAKQPDPNAIVRGLYVNRFAAQSARKLPKIIGFADSTEVNALVIDIKDEFGLNYRSENPTLARNAGSGYGVVRDVKALVDTLHAHGIVAIARIVVFKDPVAASLNAGWTIRRPDGSVWRDEKGNAWVNPYNRDVWAYNLGVAEEMVRAGFDEIQFDYIRFPEPYSRLPKQVFPGADGVSKPDLIAAFLKEARGRLNPLGARSTADVFGLTTTVMGPLEIAQHWERVAPVTDALLPMVYPSHYPRGSLGVAHPNAEPYEIVFRAIKRARERNEALGIHGEHVRPYLQAFTLGKPPYEAEHVRQQIRAVYDAGYEGWVLWHPGSTYDPFIPALARTLERQAKR